MVFFYDGQKQWREIRDQANAAMDRVGQKGQWILSDEVSKFEENVSRSLGIAHAVGCASGLDALDIALRIAGTKAGDRVLTTPLTAFATILAILRQNATPVFVDVDNTGNIDLDQARIALQSDSGIRFFVPVHLYGRSIDSENLASLQREFGITIVEDCAQSFGAASKGKMTGTSGTVAAFSFYPTKNLGALGDGGMIATGDPEIAKTAREIRNYGQKERYVHVSEGMNSRLDELQAALLNHCMWQNLDRWNKRRSQIADRYSFEIRNRQLNLPPAAENGACIWHIYPVLAEGSRNSFQSHLARNEVQSAVHYPILAVDQPVLRDKHRFKVASELTNARRFSNQEVSLPIHPWLSDAEVNVVIDACNSWRA